MDRPALQRLIDDINRRAIDCVVVYKVDRLSRSLLDFAKMMELFDKRGVSFVSVTQQFNTTNSLGRLTLNILLSFAQFEREIISERTRDKLSAARKKGKWIGGHPVLGYDIDPSLEQLSREKCWYCETKQERSNMAVDHFRPKSGVAECAAHPGYWWLALAADNYRFACTYCNSLLKDGEAGDPECHSSAMEEACFQGSLEVLRRFKPSGELDDLSLLLKEAAHFGHADVVRYLLSLSAEPNNKSNGGSTALDCCLWHLEFEDTDHIRCKKPITRYGARRTWETLQVLLGVGARWRPDDRSSVNQLRRTLLGCEPTLVIDILNLLKSSGAAGQDAIRDVVSTPSMQKHLTDKNWHLQRLGVVEKPSSKPSYISYRLLSRFNRERLYEEVWSEPMWNLASKYGVSDVALAKTCRKLKVPLPGRGYWAKVAAGKVTRTRPPLPVFPPPSAQNRKAGQ